MALKPESGDLIIGGTTLLVDDIKFQTDVQFFERIEFSPERLRQAPELNGVKPIFLELPGGRPVQLVDGCVAVTARSLLPDDTFYDSIYRRFDIRRWELQGGPTLAANVETVFNLARTHKVLLDRFEAHIARGRTNISIDALLAMQTVTGPVYTGFTYLTATGISMSGMPLGTGSSTSFSNVLLVQFSPDVDYEEPLNAAGTSSRVLRRWSAVVEQRIEVPAQSVSY